MPQLGRSDGSSTFRFATAKPDGVAALMTPTPQEFLKPTTGPDLQQMVASLHASLIDRLEGDKLNGADPRESRRMIEEAALALLVAGDYPVYGEIRARLVSLVADEVLGLGPIQPLIDDQSVSEVMVNGFDKIGRAHV